MMVLLYRYRGKSEPHLGRGAGAIAEHQVRGRPRLSRFDVRSRFAEGPGSALRIRGFPHPGRLQCAGFRPGALRQERVLGFPVRRAQLCDLDLPRDSQAHRRVYASAHADDGSLSSAYDGAGGEIKLGDPIMVRGRWAYDSAHTGYNEIHPVRTVQKTAPAPADADPFTAYLEFHKAWCLELANVPPDPPPSRNPQAPPATGGDQNMTGAQRATKDAQKRDENRWVYHPAIDGCIPRTRPDPIYSRTDLLISPGDSSGSWKER